MPEALPGFIVIAVIATLAAAALVTAPLLRGSGSPVTAVIVALAVPVGALLFYLVGSNYNWQQPTVAPAASGVPDLADAVASLEERLTREPEDQEGWLLLGNAYLQLQRAPQARQAFARALSLSDGQDPAAKLGVAEAMTLENRDALAGEAGQLVDEVLSLQPDNPRALWYGGLAALARGDRPLVQARWQKLLSLNPPDSVRQIINEQLAALGFAVQDTPPAEGTSIEVRISVSDALRDQLRPGAMLFLVARDSQAAGPPVAAVRERAEDLPRVLRISDANAMIPGRSLSQLEEVRLIARVSNGGDALAKPGDVFGETTWSTGAGAAEIVMDQVVQP